jgi:chemotaxis signal transduction protein
VRDVQMLDPAAAQPAAALGLAPSPVLAGLLPVPGGGQALLVDVQALVTANPLAALSAAQGAREAGRESATQAHVVVQAGAVWALPISALLEIIELPPAWEPGSDPSGSWCHTWRQRALPLWDLRALTGHGVTPRGAGVRVLIVQSDTQPFGLVVEAVLHLLAARTSELHRLRVPGGRVLPFVVERHGAEQRSFAVLGTQDWPLGLAH